MNRNKLIIFARPPILGEVKQRLANQIGSEKALEVYKKLLKHTIDIADQCGTPYKLYSTKKYPNFPESHDVQIGEDLGIRMFNALQAELDERHTNSVCLIGSDTAEITSGIIRHAFIALEQHDLVLGPANDGGYYLIGMKQAQHGLFSDMTWSTDRVLKETIRRAKALNLNYTLLPWLNDVDTAKDLPTDW